MVSDRRRVLLLLLITVGAVLFAAKPADAGFVSYLRSVQNYLYGDTCFVRQFRFCREALRTDVLVCAHSALQLCDIWLEGWERIPDYDKIDPTNYDW